jgi:hypothetical protein
VLVDVLVSVLVELLVSVLVELVVDVLVSVLVELLVELEDNVDVELLVDVSVLVELLVVVLVELLLDVTVELLVDVIVELLVDVIVELLVVESANCSPSTIRWASTPDDDVTVSVRLYSTPVSTAPVTGTLSCSTLRPPSTTAVAEPCTTPLRSRMARKTVLSRSVFICATARNATESAAVVNVEGNVSTEIHSPRRQYNVRL